MVGHFTNAKQQTLTVDLFRLIIVLVHCVQLLDLFIYTFFRALFYSSRGQPFPVYTNLITHY